MLKKREAAEVALQIYTRQGAVFENHYHLSMYIHCYNNIMAPSKDPKRLFPSMLHRMMEESEEKNFNDCISWVQIDGYCHAFKVHNKTKFEKEVLPLYFKTAYYKSFQRLVLYCLFFSSFLQEHLELLLLLQSSILKERPPRAFGLSLLFILMLDLDCPFSTYFASYSIPSSLGT